MPECTQRLSLDYEALDHSCGILSVESSKCNWEHQWWRKVIFQCLNNWQTIGLFLEDFKMEEASNKLKRLLFHNYSNHLLHLMVHAEDFKLYYNYAETAIWHLSSFYIYIAGRFQGVRESLLQFAAIREWKMATCFIKKLGACWMQAVTPQWNLQEGGLIVKLVEKLGASYRGEHNFDRRGLNCSLKNFLP